MVVAVLLIVIAGLMLLANAFRASFACSTDSSTCARSTEKNGVYETTLVDQAGTPYRSREFLVEFRALRSGDRVAFRTDRSGHVCIQWASESSYPLLLTAGGDELYARYVGGQYQEPVSSLREWQDLEGREPPPGCQQGDRGIPWYRAEGATGSWQYLLLQALPAAAILALLLALVGHGLLWSRRVWMLGALLLASEAIVWLILS
jgi:hypothetical protein